MTTDKDAETLANPEVIELVRDKLEELRKRLLDSTRRNPLININFRPNSAAVMRVVDELPDVLRYNLTSGTAMRLVSLPALEEELADEQSREFQEALFHARRGDETFLAELDKLDPSAEGVAEKEDRIERRLKDRVRAQLDLPERQTKEALSLSKYRQRGEAERRLRQRDRIQPALGQGNDTAQEAADNRRNAKLGPGLQGDPETAQ